MKNILGVLGGMGPMAGALFYKMITEMTVAERDQDHLNMIIISDVQIPDRSTAILNGDDEPGRALHKNCKILESLGCKAICATCNTAHYFLHQFEDLSIPIISMVKETAKEMGRLHRGEKIALLATNGTIKVGLYQEALKAEGVEPYICSEEGRKATMHLIYDCIKGGKPADKESLAFIDKEIKDAGCAGALLACTELSVIKDEEKLDDFYTDPMEVLAARVIEFMGKEVSRPE
ncbi:MAG: amino acid racemase [Clostridiales bacterium]|mgnify:CR=1 FL=1|nr:amino acid racemase [Clostridiales bacterium]